MFIRRIPCVLFVLVFALALEAQDKAPISAAVNNATYVFVTTPSGDIFSPDVVPDDRHAVMNTQKAIEQWGRYKIVYKSKEADLILVVRTGRAVEAHASAQKGGSTSGRGSAESVGGEVGDPQDTLEVYSASQIGGVPLWRGRAPDGLRPPEMQLVQEFRSKVEATAKKP